MKYKVIGLESGSIYAEGSKAHCFRLLKEKYPYGEREYNGTEVTKRNHTGKTVYPEPLMIVGPGVTKEHILQTQNELRLSNKM